MYKLVKLCLHGDVNVRGHLAKKHYPSCSSQANDNPPTYIVHELHMYRGLILPYPTAANLP